MSTELERAYDYCQQIARENAKNFYYAFRTLPAAKRRAIYAVYAFCRICDDIADDDIPLVEKRQLLGDTRRRLSFTNGNTPVFDALRDAAVSFNIPARYFEEIIEGVEMDLIISRFDDFDALKTYSYKVASVVGLICLEVFGYKEPQAVEYAIDLGIAMQLTNIIRDVKEDADRERIYLPLDEMARFGYTERDLMDGVVNKPFQELMAFQTERARRHFESGKKLIPLISPESRPCVAVLHGIYSAVLDRIEASRYQVFEKRISLSTREKVFLTARLWAGSRLQSMPLLSR